MEASMLLAILIGEAFPNTDNYDGIQRIINQLSECPRIRRKLEECSLLQFLAWFAIRYAEYDLRIGVILAALVNLIDDKPRKSDQFTA
jgi:hypothetical protein